MIIVANWKAKVGALTDAKKLFLASKKIADAKKHHVILAPSMPFLGVLSLTNTSKVLFAGQDITRTDGGAQTGEVTGSMLSAVKAKYVIIGHSERRALGESDADVLIKTKNALSAGLIPIVCIGEKERDAEAHYLAHLRTQIDAIYSALQPKERGSIIWAYEPVWAIGKSASESITPDDLTEMIRYIRKILSAYLSKNKVGTTPILYGGAVEPLNAKVLTQETGVDGLLIGHASTDARTFTALIKSLS